MNPRQPRTFADRIIPDHCRTQTLHRVCVADTDMMGIVHHGNYVALFERGRLEYLRQRGLPYKAMVERGYHMPVVELNVRYKKPARFDDLLQVETRLGALSRVTVRFNYAIRRCEPDAPLAAELLLEGHILLACVDERNRPRPLPEDVVETLFLPELSLGERVTPDSRADRADSA